MLCAPCCAANDNKEIRVGSDCQEIPGLPGQTIPSEDCEDHRAYQTAQDVGTPQLADCLAKAVDYNLPEDAETETATDKPPVVDFDVPPPHARKIHVVVDKTLGGDLGMDVDFVDAVTLKVVTVKEGLIANWNSCNLHKIAPGDKITAVNGASGNAQALLAEVAKKQVLNLTVEKKGQFQVAIMKGKERCGMIIDSIDCRIVTINEGPVKRYNEALRSNEFAIKPHDLIIECNGCTDMESIMDALGQHERLDMTMLRQ